LDQVSVLKPNRPSGVQFPVMRSAEGNTGLVGRLLPYPVGAGVGRFDASLRFADATGECADPAEVSGVPDGRRLGVELLEADEKGFAGHARLASRLRRNSSSCLILECCKPRKQAGQSGS
jgi:hypothetical protein